MDKFIGDAVMAVFGAPVAHEDDPMRAVRAGLDMQKAIAAFNAEFGHALGLRIGINSGEVLWGSVAGERPTAMGDAVNVAQRLESVARTGSVRVSESVERATRRGIRYGGLEEVTVKGRAEPVRTYEALEATAAAAEVRETSAMPLPLAGREGDLRRLEELFAGGARVVVIEGEAGIGKSRLMAEQRRVLRAGSRVTWIGTGRCIEGVRVPLVPFGEMVREEGGAASGVDLVRRLAGQLEAVEPEPQQREVRAQLIALSLGLAPADAAARGINPERLWAETCHAWRRWIEARAAAGSALLCVEDLHWADDSTLALLAELQHAPSILVLATSRPGGAPSLHAPRLPLGEIERAGAARLARSALRAPASPELAEFLFNQTAGHPYYLEELARFLRENNRLEGAPLRLRAAPEGIPESLAGLLTSRLDALDAETREAVKAGSAVGRVFWTGLLEKLCRGSVAAALEVARKRRVIDSELSSLLPGDTQHAFRHALLREAAYALLTKKDRQRLHGEAADHLEAQAGGTDRRLMVLAAAQREAAGQKGPSAGLWLRAASQAYRESSFAEALAQAREAVRLEGGTEAALVASRALAKLGRFEEALAAAGSCEPLAGRLMVAHIHALRGDWAKAEPELEAMESSPLPLLDRLAARELSSRCLNGRGRFADSLAVTAGALRELPGTASPEEADIRSRLLMSHATALTKLGRHEETVKTIEEGLALATQRGDRSAIARCLGVLGNVHLAQARFPAAVGVYEKAEKLLRESGDRLGLATALGNLSLVHFAEGRAAEGWATVKECLGIRREVGDRAGLAMTLGNLGARLSDEGRNEEALAYYRESLEMARANGAESLLAWTLGNAGTALMDTGRLSEAKPAIEEASILIRKSGDREGMATVLGMHARIVDLLGERELAEKLAAESLSVARASGLARLVAWSNSTIAAMAVADARWDRARASAEEVRPFLQSIGDARGLVHHEWIEADILLEEGKPAEARALMERTLEVHGKKAGPASNSGLRLWLARADVRDGRLAEARKNLEAGIADARFCGTPERLAEILLEAHDLLVLNGPPVASEFLTEAKALVPRLSPVLAAEVLAASAAAERSADLLARARALSAAGRPRLLARLRFLMRDARASRACGDPESARRILQEGIALAESAGARASALRLRLALDEPY